MSTTRPLAAPRPSGRAPEPDRRLLTLEGVDVSFGGIHALQGVNLDVAEKQVLGVIGPNGAGKTTLFNVACGFVTPQAGRIGWRGAEIRGHRPHQLARLGIGRTLQGLGLFDRMTVIENVMAGAHSRPAPGFVASMFGLPRAERRERALRAEALTILDELGIAAHAESLPPELPYPLRKRVALARALVAEPDLLLLDEPAGGLAQDEVEELGELVRRLAQTRSVMLVEHHMELVMAVCDDIVVLDFGRVIARGTPAEISDDPAVTAAYLGADVRAPGPFGELH